MEALDKDVKFVVDEDKCVKCGLCSNDCPLSLIKLDEYPKLRNDNFCIECQHCFAVCPTGALSILENDPQELELAREAKVDSEEFAQLIKTRRSVRRYKNHNLDKDVLQKLCNDALYAPSAKNCRTVHYTVVDNKDKMHEIRDITYGKLEGTRLKSHGFNFSHMSTAWRRLKFDRLFLGAPHMIIAHSPKNYTYAHTDAVITLSYFELLANSLKLGTLWNGIVTHLYRDIMPEIKEHLNIPEDHEIEYVMLFGKPAVKYKHAVKREPSTLHMLG